MVSLENYKILLEIEYDGTDFCGWQIQPNARTIQGNLEGALKKLFCKEIRLHGSGRTDSGVHALRQIAHFNPGNTNLNPGQIEKGLNRFTDVDIFIHRVEKMPVDFHSRFSAIMRRYQYKIIREPFPLLKRFAWFPNCSWDDELAARACGVILGTHSFKSFCRKRPEEEEYLCKIFESKWEVFKEGAVFEICADRLFHQMVRGIVRSILNVARGYYTMSQLEEFLHNPEANASVQFAPAQGLVLTNVYY